MCINLVFVHILMRSKGLIIPENNRGGGLSKDDSFYDPEHGGLERQTSSVMYTRTRSSPLV